MDDERYEFCQGQEIYLFCKTFRQAVGSIRPSARWVPGGWIAGGKVAMPPLHLASRLGACFHGLGRDEFNLFYFSSNRMFVIVSVM
jgi:hypothetical protein